MSAPPSSRHLLIPFAGCGPACREALAGLRLPKLETLLARLALAHEDLRDDDTLSPPHERALAQALGLAAADGCIPWAALEARRMGLQPADASWGALTLCHWRTGLDSVVLDDPGAIEIDAAESAALLAAARPFFAEDGITLHASSAPGRWLAHGAMFDGLATASIDRAAGRPISEWLSLSEATRPLRRLQSEMQMLLYTHPVNDERERRGATPVNSFWLSGAGRLPVSATPNSAPVIADALRAPALRGDGAAWAAAWRALDAGPIAGLLADAGRGAAVSLTLCGERGARRFETRPRGLAGWLKQLLKRPNAAAVLEAL
jgi:hypothetical protein